MRILAGDSDEMRRQAASTPSRPARMALGQRMKPWVNLGWGLALMFAGCPALRAAVVPVLPPDPVQSFALQRSLALMAASHAPDGPEVRVLFYGQSITLQAWAREVEADLRKQFPAARFVFANHAISSFGADYLMKTAEADVYPFRPDLIILHCYGPYGRGLDWERIWGEFRRRTTADIIMLGNHITVPAELYEMENPALQRPEASQYWLNYVFAPEIAERNGLCFPDNRSQWRAYLRTNGLPVSALLEDGVHLNVAGNQLLAAILRLYLGGPRFQPSLDPLNNGRILTVPATDPRLQWQEGRLQFEFTGNRVDVLGGGAPTPGFRVRVDGTEPTRLPGGQVHGRASGWPGHWWWPALLHVQFEQILVPETWTLTVTTNNLFEAHDFQFSVEGSVTGKDGNGTTTARFVSNSGRVVIDPADWDFQQLPYAVGVGAQIIWTSSDTALDHVGPTDVPLPEATALFSGLTDGPHVLVLEADDPAAQPVLGGLRVYHPAGPAPGTEPADSGPAQVRLWRSPREALWAWPASEAGEAQTAPGLGTLWNPLPTAQGRGFKFGRIPTEEPATFLRLLRP